MTIHRLTDGNHRALQKTFESLMAQPSLPTEPWRLHSASANISAKKCSKAKTTLGKDVPNDVYQHSIAARPTKRNGPQIIARHPQHCGPHKTRSENFIRPYLGQKRLPTGSSLLIGKPKTSPFRSCHPQRLSQRTLKVTVQRLALKLPKRITFFAEENSCQKNTSVKS